MDILSKKQLRRKKHFGFIICILLVSFLLIFNVLFQHKHAKVYASIPNFFEILFEPYNAISMPESGKIYIPFIAGWISDGFPQLSFDKINVYAIIEDDKEFLFDYSVSENLISCYMNAYINSNGDAKLVKNVESSCVYDSTEQQWILCYDETLKEAIGFSGTNSNALNNDMVFNKVFDSLDEDKMINLQMTDVFDDFNVGDMLVFILEGIFYLPGNPQPLSQIEREVTIYVTTDYDDVNLMNIPMPTPEIGGLDKRFRDLHSFYKGDGHLHSIHSDGRRNIEHNANEINVNKKMNTIAHYRREIKDMDWLIFTDHANRFWPGQKTGNNGESGEGNFNSYNANCNEGINSAQAIERECLGIHPKPSFLVVPAIELSITDDSTICMGENSSAGHILSYYGPHELLRAKRLPDDRVNGTDYVKNIVSEDPALCNGAYFGSGPYGWAVIAHPTGSLFGAYPWSLFPQTLQEWNAKWNDHKCPSIIRSFDDDDHNNDGKGFMGLEIITGSFIDTKHWDAYLFYDTQCTLAHWNKDQYNNNFVIGYGNSDCHNWHFGIMEDLTGIKKAHLSGNCILSINEVEAREVPSFEHIPYWFSRYKGGLFGVGCTFVYLNGPPTNSMKLLEALRSCGENNKGITSSYFGSFATFYANSISQGGRITNLGSQDLQLSVYAYPYLNQLGRIVRIDILGRSWGTVSSNPRLLWTQDYFFQNIQEMEGWQITISNEDLFDLDYIRMEIMFEIDRFGLVYYDFAFTNPLFIAK